MTDRDDLAIARDALLDSLGEDDHGVWELLASTRTALPDLDEDELRAATRAAMGRLTGEGLAELVRGRALDNEPVQPVDVSELDAPDAWEPAGDQPSYLSGTLTPAGEEAYYALLQRRAGEGDGG